MSARVLSPANEITVLRIMFAPIFGILVVDRHYLAALVVLGVAAVSDFADGFVARAFHQQTPLGVALDPIADKILMTTAFLVLSFRGALPWWLTIVVITRDVGILLTAGAISLVAGYRPFPPSVLGKASTSSQVGTILVALAARVWPGVSLHPLVHGLIDLTAALAAASGLHYLFVARHRFGLASSAAEAPEELNSQRIEDSQKVEEFKR
jgi:cardiolipin synthase (CMP-forming)